jgi:hypothetical protein
MPSAGVFFYPSCMIHHMSSTREANIMSCHPARGLKKKSSIFREEINPRAIVDKQEAAKGR